MIKKKYIFFIAIISIMLCACSNVDDTSTIRYSELMQTCESDEFVSIENTENIEDTEQKMEANVSDTDFFTSKSTSSFEYDSVNNTITIDGIVYTIATSEIDYSGGYMPYFIVNSNVEDIMNSINNNDLTNKYWRDGIPEELQEKVNKSTLLESFVNGDGKILDYYIINGDFYQSAYDAEVPVVIKYSFNEETYYTIWVFYMQAFVESEVDVQYQITDIFQLDNLDGYTQEPVYEDDIYISKFSKEDSYLLSSSEDFYEMIAFNPIIQKCETGGGESTLDMVQKAYEKCDIWNQQIDYTGTQLSGLLNDSGCEKLQEVLNLWDEYYKEKVSLYQSLFGTSGIIPGSMYTQIAADTLADDNKLMAYALLSLEYELSQNAQFVIESEDKKLSPENINWYDFSEENLCIEYCQDFEEMLNSYSLDEKNSEELLNLEFMLEEY